MKRGFLALVVVLEASQALRFYILIYLLCLIFSLPSPGTSRLMMGHNMKHITFTKTVTNYLKYKWYIPNSNGMQLNISPSPDVNSNLGEGGEKESNRIYIALHLERLGGRALFYRSCEIAVTLARFESQLAEHSTMLGLWLKRLWL